MEHTLSHRRQRACKTLRLTAGALFLCAAACADDEHWTKRTSENRGMLCFVPREAALATLDEDGARLSWRLEPDAPLTAYVEGHNCMSACSRHQRAHCSLSVEGRKITLTSKFDWEEPGEDKPCVLSCIKAVATCTTSTPLTVGSYTLQHGDELLELNIPSDVSETCWF